MRGGKQHVKKRKAERWTALATGAAELVRFSA